MYMDTNVWGVQLHFNWRREALSLYRDILRASRHFTWKNEHGEVWGKVIAVSTRTEYEQARDETDPEVIARLIATGRDCLDSAMEKVAAKHQSFVQSTEATRNPGRRP